EQLEKIGLVKRRNDNSGFYDRFRSRVMIPINDIFGHTVGFGGRILVADDNSPKYLNSPETVLFNKRNLLFGLDKAHLSINSAGFAIVVEGYMDAISLVAAGIKNVVATLGTAFTPEHAKLIMRYARKIIFCYDSDEAGQRATMRALPIVQAVGAEVFIVKVPDGKDPDEFIRNHGKAAFDELTKKAMSLIDYQIDYVLAHVDTETAPGKIQALQKILPVVAKVTGVNRNEYRKKIALALVLEESVVNEEWRKFSAYDKSSPQVVTKKFSEPIDPALRTSGETILRMLWHDSDLISYVTTAMPLASFAKVHQEIFLWLKRCADNDKQPNDLTAAKELSEQAFEELSRILLRKIDERDANDVNAFEDSIKSLNFLRQKKEYTELLAQAEEYMASGNPDYIKKFREAFKLKEQMDDLQGIEICTRNERRLQCDRKK
ncbi:MAG: toprim domain-containing protein, partial [Selenomonadaceae bacterium]|nr:toprim domain-containing protein [Selenomonadaceae bacterium]